MLLNLFSLELLFWHVSGLVGVSNLLLSTQLNLISISSTRFTRVYGKYLVYAIICHFNYVRSDSIPAGVHNTLPSASEKKMFLREDQCCCNYTVIFQLECPGCVFLDVFWHCTLKPLQGNQWAVSTSTCQCSHLQNMLLWRVGPSGGLRTQ